MVFSLLAFLPAMLGLCGTLVGASQVEAHAQRAGWMDPEQERSIVAAGKQEAKVPTFLGVGATAGLLLAAGCGALFTKAAKQPQTNR